MGRTVTVYPRSSEGRPNVLHQAFIGKLRRGHVWELELRSADGRRFEILELTGEQRRWAAD